MRGLATECFVRHIPFQDVKDALMESEEYKQDWHEFNPQEKRQFVEEWINDMDWEYDSTYMSDYNITKKFIDGREVENTHDAWMKRWAQPHEKYAVYYEAYEYNVSYVDEDDLDENDWEIDYYGKGAISDCGWIVSDELMEFLG